MKDSVDEKLAVTMYDVPVPPGLAERLLARLAAEQNRPVEELPATKDQLAVSRSAPFVPRLSGRWFLVGSGLAALAVGLLLAVWLGMNQGEGLSEQFVLDEAIRSLDVRVGQPGHLLAEHPGPGAYPFSLAVVQVRVRQVASLEGGFVFGASRRGLRPARPGWNKCRAVCRRRWDTGRVCRGARAAPFHNRRVLCLSVAAEWLAVCSCGARRSGDISGLSESPARPRGVMDCPSHPCGHRHGSLNPPNATDRKV